VQSESKPVGEEQGDEVVVRPALPEDREAVLAFCAHTWEGGDYIALVFDQWLHDESGALLVAVIGRHPVGLVHVQMPSADDSWLEGIRVDPAVRRQGIGRLLVSQALVAARARGAGAARLFTDNGNIASQELVTKRFGFQRVAEVVRYIGKALESERAPKLDALQGVSETHGPRLLAAGPEDRSRIWDWLLQSNLAPVNGGLQFDGWQAWALTEQDLQVYLSEEAVWLLEEWETIQAIAIALDAVEDEEDPETGTLQVRYIDGAAGGIGALAVALREIAAERHLSQVEMWLPDLLILHDAMNGAGYLRAVQETMWVYQRSLYA
jgi:ribosomal protein S18 acetylase RimI-like enzyme